MLPSQGLFRSIPCPFFLAGLCERPQCSYRHCRSDIRIDRKLDTEVFDEAVEEGQEEALSSTSTQDDPKSKQVIKNEAPISNCEEAAAVSSVKSKNSFSNQASTTNANQTERLISAKESHPKSRKRSSDLDAVDLSKRRRVSEDKSGEMGSVLSTAVGTFAGACRTVINSCLPKEQPKVEKDIDTLVREIEAVGKPSPESKSTRHNKHKKQKHHRHRDRDSSSSKDRRDHRRDSQTSTDGHRKKDKEKDRERKDPKEQSSTAKVSQNNGEKKDKPSKVSSCNVKDETPHRRLSSASEIRTPDKDKKGDGLPPVSTPKKERRPSGSDKKGDGMPPVSTPKKERRPSGSDKKGDGMPPVSTPKKERRPSGTSSGKGGSLESFPELLIRTESPTISISNRFNALAESSESEAESAYTSSEPFDIGALDFIGSDLEDDPESVARECFELFENYKPEDYESTRPGIKTPSGGDIKEDNSDDGFCLVGKKRVAHGNAVIKTPSIPASPVPQKKAPPATSKTLQDVLHKRFEDQTTKQRPTLQNGSPLPTMSPFLSTKKLIGKARIAHVPNAGLLALKPSITAGTLNTSPTSRNTPGQPGAPTYSQTAAKGVPREAHKSSVTVVSKKGPIVLRDAITKSSRIPQNTRQLILDKMYAEYLRIMENADQAFEATVKRENELLGKCSTKQVYYSSGISAITGLRKTQKQDELSNSHQHPDLTLYGPKALNCSYRVSKGNSELPTGNKLYVKLTRYLMTEEQLEENGYPRPHPSKETGRIYAKPRQGETTSNSLTNRVCDRCRKYYRTTDEGEPIIAEVCSYHWGRKYNQMARGGRGSRETSYSCCGSDDDKIGCVTAVSHVSKCPVPLSSQKGFVTAVYDADDVDLMGSRPWDIIGIDCEMVYTTHGNELARVTVVGVGGDVLYDTTIKPTHRVLDCNTRFSGLTFDDLEKATTSITDVQAVLLTFLRPNTIIIGHSLESDLIALRIRHDSVIDTSILYPHRMGPPKKRALRTLSAEILNKVIQDGDCGHDSAEDAQVAVELVLAKLKNDMACK